MLDIHKGNWKPIRIHPLKLANLWLVSHSAQIFPRLFSIELLFVFWPAEISGVPIWRLAK
jgi:hypothetical protein